MTPSHRNRSCRLLGWLLLPLMVAAVAVPPAQAAEPDDDEASDPRAEASTRFRRGVKLFNDGDFVAALVEFKRAYELQPHYRVLYNLGQTSRELKDYATALRMYEQYLDEGGKEIGQRRKKEVQGYVEDLTNRVGTLTIVTNVDGAEIQIDDVVVGVSPLDDPIVVNVGRRRVAATLPGHAAVRRVIEVAGTDELEVELALAEQKASKAPPSPPPKPPPKPPPPEPGTPVAGIVAAAITGASAVVTAVLGGLALSARGDMDDALAAFPGNPETIQDAQDRTASLATGTDVLLGITAAAAVTTVVLFIVSSGSDSEADPDESDSARRRSDRGVSVSVAAAPFGLLLNGSF